MMKSRMSNVYGVLAVAGLFFLSVSPVSAQGNTQIAGTGVFDGGVNCGVPPAGFEDYIWFTLELDGDLVGCLDTLPEWGKVTNGNTYQERGREVIEACLDLDGDGCDPDDPYGVFETTYHFTSKWAGVPFESAQINGRCQHPIVGGSGTDDFSGATGRLDFKDDVAEGDFDWKGHIGLADDT
jgi:hypothetical protein